MIQFPHHTAQSYLGYLSDSPVIATWQERPESDTVVWESSCVNYRKLLVYSHWSGRLCFLICSDVHLLSALED